MYKVHYMTEKTDRIELFSNKKLALEYAGLIKNMLEKYLICLEITNELSGCKLSFNHSDK